jgi:hypothetical protein
MLRAFHNNPELKEKYLARVRAHRAADEIIHASYWQHGKGCAVGCTVHSDRHEAYETELGIPLILARLEDSIFEALKSPRDCAWPEDFLAAIPTGADLAMVWPRFALRLLADREHGVLRHVQKPRHAKLKDAIEKVIASYQQWIKTGSNPADEVATAAASTAATAAAADYAAYAADAATAAAADYAAYAADAAAAAYAAAAAADAAVAAAAYAAVASADAAAAVAAAAYAAVASADAAAAAAAAADAALKDAREWQADTLLALLREAPQPEVSPCAK